GAGGGGGGVVRHAMGPPASPPPPPPPPTPPPPPVFPPPPPRPMLGCPATDEDRMPQQPSGRLLPALVLSLLAAVALMVGLLGRSDVGLSALPLRDFVEYWAAGRLLADGQSPYDVEAVDRLEREAARDEDAILYWAPPYALAYILPLGALPVRVAHLLWLAVQLGALVLWAELLWRAYGGSSDGRLAAHALTFSF